MACQFSVQSLQHRDNCRINSGVKLLIDNNAFKRRIRIKRNNIRCNVNNEKTKNRTV